MLMVILAALVYVPSTAQSDNLTFQESIPLTPLDWTQQIFFPMFDPGLGTLNTVDLLLQVNSFTGSLTVTNPTPVEEFVIVDAVLLTSLVGLQPNTGSLNITTTDRDSGTISPGASMVMNYADSDYKGQTLNNVTPFLGSGTLGYEVQALTNNRVIVNGQVVADPNNWITNENLQAAATLILTYNYTPVPEPPPPALVGFWNFDEDSEETAYDSSAYGNDGAIEGATPAVGKCGNAALSFDGGSDGGIDYVVVPNSDSINTSTFTVSCWVSISDLDKSMVFLHKRNGPWYRNFQLSYIANNDEPTPGQPKDYLRIKIDDNGTPTPSNDFDNAAYAEVDLESGKFYYVAATYDQSYLRLFLNGSPIAQIAEFPIDITGNVGDGDLYIGAHSAQHLTMNPTNGIIDEVRIYNYALTQEQIQADMEACGNDTHGDGIPDTGQTQSYTNTFGEDSDYTINPPSYTLNLNPDGSLDGTTTDNITGLMWQSSDNNNIYNWYEASGTPDATYNPDGTVNVCGDLSLAGYTDWRLPTVKELQGIVNYDAYFPSIDQTAFPGTNSDHHWSSTLNGQSVTSAWDVNFKYGAVYGQSTSLKVSFVRCVRDGQQNNQAFINNGDGTVTDAVTGLTWQQEDDNATRTWEEAITYCEDLELPVGQNDWRLPNIKELLSIVDNSQIGLGPAIDPNYFLETNLDLYWSSTSSANYPTLAWAVHFQWGQVGAVNGGWDKTLNYYARCVRGPDPAGDTDGDGVPDYEDDCPTSDLSPTVVIDGCDSGVENELFDDGCTISDTIAELADNSTNHGKCASAVSHYTNELKKDGVISGKQKGAIQSCAGQAGIP